MKKANSAAVGAFVLGAIALLFAGIVIFGGANLFADTVRYSMFFDGSVNGLTVGSPVKMQGVEIGTVIEVNALADASKALVVNEIIVEIDRSRFKRTGPQRETRSTQFLIEHGLRGRLELESIVTGQLYVGVDFYPDTEVRLIGLSEVYDELPTIPSLTAELENTVREFFSRLKDAPIEDILVHLNHSLEGASAILNSPDLAAAVAQLDDTVGDARSALQEARTALASVDSAIEPNSDVRYQLSVALDELAGAARAIRLLADYIERNPNAVVFGRAQGEE